MMIVTSDVVGHMVRFGELGRTSGISAVESMFRCLLRFEPRSFALKSDGLEPPTSPGEIVAILELHRRLGS